MPHLSSVFKKVMKQLNNCPEVTMKSTKKGYMIMSNNGEQYLIHMTSNPMGLHKVSIWLKQNTSLKDLRF